MNAQLEQIFSGNKDLVGPIAAAVIFVAVFLLLKLFKSVVGSRFVKLASRFRPDLEPILSAAVGETRNIFLAAIAGYIAAFPLKLEEKWMNGAEKALILIGLYQVYRWASALVGAWANQYSEKHMEADAGAATTVRAVAFILRIVIASAVFLIGLDNLGVNVTALIAGLGVGGIAVGLALQNILGDLFSSLTIVLDKPFVIGDFIVVGDLSGTVEHVGLKSTRIRSLSGEQLVFGNADLLTSRIRNYRRMNERRIAFQFGVIYQTNADQLERINEIVREICEKLEMVRLDRVHFFSFGASSLDFEVVYYVLSPEYLVYMDQQQAINLEMVRAFEKEGIDFAYPTQTIFVEKVDGVTLPQAKERPPEYPMA